MSSLPSMVASRFDRDCCREGGELLERRWRRRQKKDEVEMQIRPRLVSNWSSNCVRCMCPVCSGVARPTIEDMKKVAAGRNGSCLSSKYIDARTKLVWRCEKGHRWKATPSAIKAGSWCPSCFRERLSKVKRIGPIDVLIKLAQRNGGLLRSKENMGSRVRHEWECEKGHRWMAKPTAVQQGSWCPLCSQARRQCR